METDDSPAYRNRNKKLNDKKLTALERLKKARQGEKVEEEEEEEEEELYDYVEEYEDDYYEDNYESSKKKNSKNRNKDEHDSDKSKKSTQSRKNLTKDKTSNINEDETDSPKNDIRTAFFRASANAKPKAEKKLTDSSATLENDDDLANEIMLELNKKSKPISNRPKPTLTPNRPAHIPFSINSSVLNKNISLSPAFKRKLSPNSSNKTSDENSRSCKKIELDDNLVQQLLDNDSCDSDIKCVEPNEKIQKLNDVSNSRVNLLPVKSEPIEFDSQVLKPNDNLNLNIKKEKLSAEESEEFENIELLSQLSLDATNQSIIDKQLNLPIKQEGTLNDTMNDMDLQMHMKNQANSNKLLFYWIDAYEDTYNSNGTVYLFGKMPIVKQNQSQTETQSSDNLLSFASVCCVIKNIPRVVHVLPRKYKKSFVKSEPGSSDTTEPVTMDKVQKEIQSILEKNRIELYKTRIVKKNFAFDRRGANKLDEEIPYESEYLEVEYFQDQHGNRQLSADLQGEYFSCIFGTQTSCLEHLLIDLKFKGPCWLLATNAKRKDTEGGTGGMLSWSKVEYLIDNYRNISIYHEGVTLESPSINLPPTPPLSVLTLVIRTMLNQKSQEHEIVSACGLINHKFYLEKATIPSTIKTQSPQAPLYDSYFCALTKPSNGVFPYDLQNLIKANQQKFRIELCGSERALLAFLLCKIQSLDVDIIVGHDLFGFNFDIILNRCVVNKVPHWSRLGRLKRSNMPNLPGHNSKRNTIHNSGANNLAIQQRIQTVCSGRLLCDIMISAKELLTKCKSFDLNELVSHILFKKDQSNALSRDYEEEKNVAAYFNNSQLLLKFLQLTMMDTTYIMRIFNDLQCLQLAYQITCIAGNVLSRTLTGGRSERNEYLLLHAFHDKDFILPEKYSSYSKNTAKAAQNKSASNKSILNKTSSTQVKAEMTIPNQTQMEEDLDDELLSKIALDDDNDDLLVTKIKSEPKVTTHSSNSYTGGLVLDPKIGFYDKFILLLDFNSLYPSIIQEYNICFTTISRPANDIAEKDIDEYLETCIKLPGQEEKPGILPLEIRKLVDSRRQVKQLMQDKSLSSDLKMQYDIRQKALKLTANSVYGCLGFENSRFYCKPLAALITKNGRSILLKTKELVESKKIEVIYGDTDSIMINTNLNDYDQVIKLGNMIKGEVNKLYKHLEIDIDGVFKCLLLLRKKKYAALTIIGRNPKDLTLQYQQEIKGLDVVRRDWCLLAKQIGEKVISEILSGQQCDVVLGNINKILNETAEKIKNNSYDLSVFEISKQLNRNPEDYSDANHQPHVLVALRHNKDVNNSKKFKSGDVVSYVICEDGTQNSSTQRAFSKSELLKSQEALKLDTKYYLTQQIHPVVTRLCEPIEGIDAYHIARSLGLDPSGFKHKSSSSGSSSGMSIAIPQLTKQQKKIENFMNELEKFTNCIPFKYICPDCKTECVWQSAFIKSNVKQEPVEVKMEADGDDDEDIKLDGTSIVISNKKAFSMSNLKSILDSCSNPSCKTKPITKLAYIKNLISLQLNKFVKQYYQTWLVCEDPMCSFRTKRISCKFFHGKPQCIECERYAACLEYSHPELYYQMKYFKFIFDSEAYKNCFKDDSSSF